MRQGQISIYYGMGKGKTAVAVGRGMRAIGEEQRVVMIQFLDYHNSKEIALLKKLEPDFRIFRFEKDRAAEDVQGAENDEALHKEIFNEIRNAFNFAKKIVDTGECEIYGIGYQQDNGRDQQMADCTHRYHGERQPETEKLQKNA